MSPSSGAPDLCPQEDAPALPVRRVTARWRNAGPGKLAGRCGRRGPRALRPGSRTFSPPGPGAARRRRGPGSSAPRSLPRARRPGGSCPRVLPRSARSATPRRQVKEGGSSWAAAGRVLPGHSDSSRDPPSRSNRSVPRHGRPARFPRTRGKGRPQVGGMPLPEVTSHHSTAPGDSHWDCWSLTLQWPEQI